MKGALGHRAPRAPWRSQLIAGVRRTLGEMKRKLHAVPGRDGANCCGVVLLLCMSVLASAPCLLGWGEPGGSGSASSEESRGVSVKSQSLRDTSAVGSEWRQVRSPRGRNRLWLLLRRCSSTCLTSFGAWSVAQVLPEFAAWSTCSNWGYIAARGMPNPEQAEMDVRAWP